ncbi:glucosamine-6-phosphate deaminase [Flavisolibacter nicotianae]|uniref:glucosamine-6-phosphate deaminase n=1 Tax=Flavisolibacter nicotianae TaxID=2364882 RepID=UPI0013C4C6E1|nr:glucosamine-6-phosphate deaminase [Flavisolibacter nicotianae]
MMKLIVAETYDSLSRQAVDDLLAIIEKKEQPLLCVASGDSPAGLYRELVHRVKEEGLDVSGWLFLSLDEWSGMNGKDEGSCRFHLDRELFGPLQVSEERICFFDGRHKDPEAECSRIENFIQQNGGIDLAIVGLGMNGHIGMNEPGTSPLLRAHIAELAEETKKVGQKYFQEPVDLANGITLGIADLADARNVFLVVNGKHKAGILQKALEEPVSETLPASWLQKHPRSTVYADKEAAALLKN